MEVEDHRPRAEDRLVEPFVAGLSLPPDAQAPPRTAPSVRKGSIALGAARFAVKHAVASAVVIAGIVAFTAASFLALFAWAVAAGEPLGGPMAFPFMVLLALAASAVVVAILLLTTALAEWICARCRWGLFAQIPAGTAILGIALLPAAFLLFDASLLAAAGMWALLLPALGVYWWSMQSVDWLLRLCSRLLHACSRWWAAR
jgi:hypothetical protein